MKPGYLYFNPEYDFVEFGPIISPLQDSFFNFLHRLKYEFDSKHVGLLNLALGDESRSAFQASDIDLQIGRTSVETLAQLKEVSFVFKPHSGRSMFGIWSNLGTMDLYFNRSLPIWTPSPVFERLLGGGGDPRLIAGDLKQLHADPADTQRVYAHWANLLKAWGVPPSATIKFSFYFAFESDHRPNDRATAAKMLEDEDDRWLHPRDPMGKGGKTKRIPNRGGEASFWLLAVPCRHVRARTRSRLS